jgi:hypothetical protein
MYLKKLSPSILITLVLFSCQTGPKKGDVTKFDSSNIEKFWLQDELSVSKNGFLLTNQSSAVTSKFQVKNFEFTAQMKTTTGAEGILVFSNPNEGGPDKGYVVKINNSDYSEGDRQKTGSLSKIRNNFVRTAVDNEWFNLSLTVKGNHIIVVVNGKTVIDYSEPANVQRTGDLVGRVLTKGRLMIKKSGSKGQLLIGEMTILPLEDKLKNENTSDAEPDSLMKVVDLLNQQEFPLIDFHCHLKGGLTMDQACQHARENGYNYGVAANCGLKFPVTSDSTLNAYLDGISKEPVFKAMQCEGREWVTLFTPEAVARFDYIFTDAMTWTDNKGRRMRLWIPEETFVDDEQKFMDMLVGKIEAILGGEPVDIHVNPTYLPAKIAAGYDRLWTPERMDRVIKVLKDNDVALEINARFKLPGIAFIKRAKEAGVKFSLGTNNGGSNDLGRLEYCLKAIKEAGLTADDMFLPRSVKNKKVMKSGLSSKITG